jgi:H+/gluconate symporter-like permease
LCTPENPGRVSGCAKEEIFMMTLLGILGMLIGIAFVIYFAYKGVSVMLIASVAAMIVFSLNGMNPITSWVGIFLPAMGAPFSNMFGLMFLGAMIAALYNSSGAALSIANFICSLFIGKGVEGEKKALGPGPAVFCIMLVAVVLSYGGISAFVISFILFPLALELMKKAGIPRTMAPGIVLGGLATAALCMPGSPQMQNVLPIKILETGPNAALIPGFIGGFLVLGLNWIAMTYLAKKEIAKGNVYTDPPATLKQQQFEKTPHVIISLLPLVTTVILFAVVKINIYYALFIGVALCVILFWRFIGGGKKIVGALVSQIKPLGELTLNGYAIIAFAAVIAAVPTFKIMSNVLVGLPIPGLFKVFIVVAALSGISGQGPSAIAASLPVFAKTFADMGLNMNAVHRVAAFSATTLDSLPTNPAFIVAGSIVGVSVASSYKYCGITTVLNTTIATLVICLLCTLFPGLAG